MKYPQLVSTRAVNAISDWLVSRLEQLGVEAPQIYTRLLLSLLQSSVQINDPIEFSNLETFFATRKGSNRRYLPCDTDTLKKLNAIQCLREIVSSEQEIATIENLVDELCEKLKDIEKQTTDIEDEDQQLVATLSVATTASATAAGVTTSAENNTAARYSLQRQQQKQQHHHQQQHIYSNNNNNNNSKHHNKNHSSVSGREELLHCSEGGKGLTGAGGRGAAGITATDLETDPKKRYFRAFPALSKEMEESFRVWRRNAKSLTWPVVDRTNIPSICSVASSTSSSSSTLSNSRGSAVSSGGAAAAAASKVSEVCGVPKSVTAAAVAVNNKVASCIGVVTAGVGVGTGLGKSNNCEAATANTSSIGGTSVAGGAAVKRKSKRRRNQALSKGKTIQNLRKNSTGNSICGTSSGTGGSGNQLATSFVGNGGRHYRNSSPTFWDTDFEGSWEMGRDLIKEFIIKQNKSNNRNRSTSESAAYGMRAAMETKKRAAAAAALPLKPASPSPVQLGHLIPSKSEDEKRQKKREQQNQKNAITAQTNAIKATGAAAAAEEDEDEEQEEQKALEATSKTSSPLRPVVDISFCCGDDDADDEYETTLASVSDLATDTLAGAGPVAAAAVPPPPPPRRLYQRDVCGFGSREEVTAALTTSAYSLSSSTSSDEQLDYEQLMAKFDRCVEALWKDAEPPAADDSLSESFVVDTFAPLHLSSVEMPAASALPAVAAPFKENLRNFWSNYYSHHFDLAKIPSMVDESGGHGNGNGADGVEGEGGSMAANTNDYCSMPPMHLDGKFDKSVGALGRHVGDFASIGYGGEHNTQNNNNNNNNTPISVFLQNSIWSSESSNATAADTDESFYFKVCNSTKKLNELEHGGKIVQAGGGSRVLEKVLSFAPPHIFRWSEGINAGPQQPIGSGSAAALRNNNNNNNNINNNNNNNNTANLIFGMPISACVDCATDSSNNAANQANQAANPVNQANNASASLSSASCSSSYTQSAAANAAAAYSWQTPINGQNLQADLQSWSASNPLSLTEMYGGSDETDGSANNINDGRANAPLAPLAPLSIITLENHSPTRSGFIAYERIRAEHALLQPLAPARPIAQRSFTAAGSNTNIGVAAAAADDDDGENLLTSERTHFRPIKTYADGHTFEICSALDTIDYERRRRRSVACGAGDSSDDFAVVGDDEHDGYLYFEGQRYLPYTRNDKTSAGCARGIGSGGDELPASSSAPLYASSNCDAANIRKAFKRGGTDEFVLKFRVRGTDIATQTEENETEEDAANGNASIGGFLLAPTRPQPKPQPHSHPLYNIFSNAAAAGMQLPPAVASTSSSAQACMMTPAMTAAATGRACNAAIEALNKAVAAAAKAAAEAHMPQLGNFWQPTSTVGAVADTAAAYCYQPLMSGTIWAAPAATLADNALSNSSSLWEDQVDFSGLNETQRREQEQWSMRAIRQNCQLKGHNRQTYSNNNNNIGEIGRSGTGTGAADAGLWGMCAACNSENRSVPANRMLRDELQQEADEIMSDLKYMQDLYIGGGAASDGDGVSDLSDWQEGDDEGNECEVLAEPMEYEGNNDYVDDEDGVVEEDDDDAKEEEQANPCGSSAVLQKVNLVIANLMRPELEDGGVDITPTPPPQAPIQQQQQQQQQFSGSLWLVADSHERNIWQHDADGDAELLTSFVDDAAAATTSAAGANVAPLNWAHDKLAQIWRQNTPPTAAPAAMDSAATSTSPTSSCSSAAAANSSSMNGRSFKKLQESFEAAIEAAVERAYEDNTPPDVDVSSFDEQQQQDEQQNEQQEEQLDEQLEEQPQQATLMLNQNEAAYKRVQQFFADSAAAVASAAAAANTAAHAASSAKVKLANRKRRHSASQTAGCNKNIAALDRFAFNFLKTNGGNNTNAGILCKKSSNEQPDGIARDDVAYFNKDGGDYDDSPPPGVGSEQPEEDDNLNQQQQQQIHFTFKYWATPIQQTPATAAAAGVGAAETITDGDGDGDDGSAAFCLLDKNSASTILKHVTMVTRPLTR